MSIRILLVFVMFPFLACGQDYPRKDINLEKLADEIFPLQELDLNYEDFYENLAQLLSNPIDLNRASREELRSQLPGRDEGGRDGESSAPNPLATLATRPEMGIELKGLLAILYQVERELTAFRPNQKSDRSRIASVAPRHLRVPACAPTPDEAILLWLRFMLTQLDQNTPLCVIYPLDEQFIDLIVGEPTPTQLFCVRASTRKIPLTTDIPYNLDAEFISRSKGMIEAERGELGAMLPVRAGITWRF